MEDHKIGSLLLPVWPNRNGKCFLLVQFISNEEKALKRFQKNKNFS